MKFALGVITGTVLTGIVFVSGIVTGFALCETGNNGKKSKPYPWGYKTDYPPYVEEPEEDDNE